VKDLTLHLRGLPPIRISAATVVTVLLVAVIVWPSFAGRGTGPQILSSLLVAVGLIVSVALHEIGHALSARASGAHVEHIALTLMGGHTSYRTENERAVSSVLISLSGPAVNLLLGVLAALVSTHAPLGSTTAQLCGLLSTLNYALGIFNLLPGLPMDGGRALEGVMGGILRDRARGTIAAAWVGRAIAVVVVGGALVSVVRWPTSIGLFVVVWAVLVGSTLWRGATSALRQARLDRSMRELRLDRLLRPARFVESSRTLAEIDAPQDLTDPDLYVRDPRRGLGRIDPQALAEVPPQRAGGTPLGAITAFLGMPGRVAADIDGEGLVRTLLATKRPVYLVTGPDGAVVGVVTPQDVNRSLRGT
jgi:Zn-dependent protease